MKIDWWTDFFLSRGKHRQCETLTFSAVSSISSNIETKASIVIPLAPYSISDCCRVCEECLAGYLHDGKYTHFFHIISINT